MRCTRVVSHSLAVCGPRFHCGINTISLSLSMDWIERKKKSIYIYINIVPSKYNFKLLKLGIKIICNGHLICRGVHGSGRVRSG